MYIGQTHTRQRKIVAEGFHFDAIEKLYPIFVDKVASRRQRQRAKTLRYLCPAGLGAACLLVIPKPET